MRTIPIHHLIYTRVEPPFSPRHRNGFQTVLCSPALEQDAAQIEAYVQCFVPDTAQGGIAPIEHQFFWTRTGKAVLVRISPIEPDAVVIDAARRPGQFIAHALVVDKASFDEIGNDPFAIFEAAELADIFAGGVETLVAYLRRHPPPSELRVKRRTRLHEQLPAAWGGDTLDGWAQTALAARAFTTHKRTLLLLSRDSRRIYAVLSTAHYLLPKEHRAACTFHTAIEGCVPEPGAYWATGARRRVNNTAFTVLDADAQDVAARLQEISPKASPCSAQLRQKQNGCGGFSAGMLRITTMRAAALAPAAVRGFPVSRAGNRGSRPSEGSVRSRARSCIQRGVMDHVRSVRTA